MQPNSYYFLITPNFLAPTLNHQPDQIVSILEIVEMGGRCQAWAVGSRYDVRERRDITASEAMSRHARRFGRQRAQYIGFARI
jgi:hypothetical protein